MLDVLFRVDDGPGIGAGHLMRCLALAEAVREQGGTIHLSAIRSSPLHANWGVLDAQIHVQPREVGSHDDFEQTVRCMRMSAADWLVVDGYGFSTAWVDSVASIFRVLCVDDIGDRDPAVKLMLNQNPGAELRYESTYRRSGLTLLGLNWFLLSRAWRQIQHVPQRRCLVLTLGGDDPCNRVLTLMLALLADGRDFIADIVSSAPEAGFQQALGLALSRPDRFVVHRSPAALPALMHRAAIVVSGGGVTPVEAASLGAVPIIVVLAANQRPGAKYLEAAGACRTIELSDTSMVAAARLALDLLDDDTARLTMAARGRSLIDGRGPTRVATAMLEKMK